MTKTNEDALLDPVYKWRLDVFNQVIAVVCNPNLSEIQQSAGVWDFEDRLPSPAVELTSASESGSMSVRFDTTAGPIIICVWMFLGEVRLGLKVSKTILIEGDDKHIHSEFHNVYDGTSCNRIQNFKHYNMYDWIFKDGFASFQFMQKSIEDETSKGMLADAIANVITHLFMSTANLLLSSTSVKFKSSTINEGVKKVSQLRGHEA